MESLRREELSELIGTIYDCSLDPLSWDATLERVSCAIACDKAILSLNDLVSDRALIYKSVGWESRWLEVRAKHTAAIHAALTQWFSLNLAPENRPFVASRDMPASVRDVAPYELECLRPQGICDVMHCLLVRTPAHFSELALCFPESSGPASNAQIEIASLLTPHLRRAVVISNVLDAKRLEREQLANALDALSCSVVLTDNQAAIVHCNAAALEMLRGARILTSRQGRLHITSVAAANQELRRSVRLCAGDAAEMGTAGLAIRLTDQVAPPVFAHVLPLKGTEIRTRLHPRAVAAVFIRTGVLSQREMESLASAFRLTPGEAAVASKLLTGRSLADAALDLGVARTTAKTHLEGIFAKTGVSRQADFIRLAMQTLPPN